MDGVQAKNFGINAETDAIQKEDAPKKRKSKNRKFIDLQKQPPRPKPLLQEE